MRVIILSLLAATLTLSVGCTTSTGSTERAMEAGSGARVVTAALSGVITEVSSEYGNLETDLGEDAVEAAGIVNRTTFTFTCRGRSFSVKMAESYSDVSRGDWVAFINWEGKLRIARSFDSAAKTSGCDKDDVVTVTPPA